MRIHPPPIVIAIVVVVVVVVVVVITVVVVRGGGGVVVGVVVVVNAVDEIVQCLHRGLTFVRPPGFRVRLCFRIRVGPRF